jgi:hypothetical protein
MFTADEPRSCRVVQMLNECRGRRR